MIAQRLKKYFVLFVVIASITGCNRQVENTNEMKEKIEALEKKVDELDTDIFVLKLDQEKFSSAAFDPAEGKGYQRIETTSGTFLVTLQDVSPHLDGVKLVLNIGNIQYATYSGFKLKVKYGRRYPKYDEKDTPEERKNKRELYTKSKREKEENFTKTLKPATWNSVSVFLPDIKPTDFGYANISITTNSVLMNIN